MGTCMYSLLFTPLITFDSLFCTRMLNTIHLFYGAYAYICYNPLCCAPFVTFYCLLSTRMLYTPLLVSAHSVFFVSVCPLLSLICLYSLFVRLFVDKCLFCPYNHIVKLLCFI